MIVEWIRLHSLPQQKKRSQTVRETASWFRLHSIAVERLTICWAALVSVGIAPHSNPGITAQDFFR